MELKEKIQAAFTASPSLGKARVVKIKSLGDRVLVYVVSPVFSGKTSLQKQRLVSKAMQEAGTFSPEDMRRVGLVRTLTPGAFHRILNARKARLNGTANKPKKKNDR